MNLASESVVAIVHRKAEPDPQMMLDLNLFTFSLCSLPFLLFFFLRLSRSAASRRPPGGPAETPCPESHPVVGNVVGFLRNRHRFHDWVADMLSRTPSSTLRVNTFLGLSRGVCTSNPLNLQHLLSSNFPNYVKGSRYHAVLRELLGDGIFAVDGHLWSLQRKIASHEFTTRSLKHFISETVSREISDRLLPFLSSACNEGRVVDLQEALQRFAFDNICSVAFGVDPNCFAAEGASEFSGRNSAFVKAFDEAVENCSSRFMSPWPALWKFKRFFNLGSEKRFRSQIRVINEFAMDIIKLKEEQIKSASERENGDEMSHDRDLLSRFMSSSADLEFRDLEEKRKFLRDIVISFVLAGKDSTSTALTWFFWLIAEHPLCERKILKELSSAASSKTEVKVFTYDELKSLHYLHAAVTESMRLFPPVPINSRLTVDDDVLPDGTRMGKGWFADYSAYAMGRSEEVWGPECREFKPERWLDGSDGDRDGNEDDRQNVRFRPSDQWKYPVFHCGPRMCLGKEMAYVQMKSVAAAVMAEFEVSPEAEDGDKSGMRMADPPYTLSLVLKMRGGLPVRLRRRR
ncbi:cytochrome P450 94A2-like [Rhodamnia argentea]|uniref:Cytochrome P450 94A2-like n=1 Tax=Rhodamnia argentea TaxID=178133 RepID=A0A8B8NKZ3_9MYRT|nr:cytochrome P450 94A2-like [Rhodamnia argentea]